MVDVLIVADDATGALDAAAQFAKQGITARMILDMDGLEGDDVQVISLSTESRHLPAAEAYRSVYRIVQSAVRSGIGKIYKKTDSALRGNIGSELQAVMDACGCQSLPFLPAYPEAGRTTVKGIHYCGGVPVAQSDVGNDPFDPVPCSDVVKLLGMQTKTPVKTENMAEQGIILINADSKEQIRPVAQTLCVRDSWAAAGSAGLAEEIAGCLAVRTKTAWPEFPKRVLFVIGSMHPASAAQADRLSSVVPVCRIPSFDDACADVSFRRCAEELKCLLREGAAVLTVATPKDARTVTENERQSIGEKLGALVRHAVDACEACTLVVAGGDSLFSVLESLETAALDVTAELEPGIVLSTARKKSGGCFPVISKAGSFGDEELLLRIYRQLRRVGE